VKLLFLALGEWETPLLRRMAGMLPAGWTARLACLLPRLAGPDDVVLSRMTPAPADVENFHGAIADRFPSAAYVANYDREWHWAPWADKHRFAFRIGGALDQVIGTFKPDLVVSSVGGETPRVALEALAAHHGIRRAYFNALPLPGRHVILSALDAPFVGYSDGAPPASMSLTNGSTPPASAMPSTADTRHRVRVGSLTEAARRLVDTRPAGTMYPRRWPAHKAGEVLTFAARQARVRSLFDDVAGGDGSTLLYPLHDEQDFQVALRERHAIPQVSLLEYVSSTIPASWRIRVRLHPAHRGAVAIPSLRRLAALPNVSVDVSHAPIEAALESTTAVLTLASSVGFDALRAGLPVVCYGRPFYSGRGLTVDVADPRGIGPALSEPRLRPPDPARLDAFLSLCDDQSFPGRFAADAVADPAHLVDSLCRVAEG